MIQKKNSYCRYLFEVLLTAFGWFFFGFLFGGGIFAILQGQLRGFDAPFLPQEFVSSLHTLLGYAILMLICATLLITWAKYNQYRFAGVDRRKPPLPLSKTQLCNSFSISDNHFDEASQAQMIIVHHDDEAIIRAIDVVNRETLLRNIVRKRMLDANHAAKQETEQVAKRAAKQETGCHNWSFVELWPSTRYEPSDSWVSQCDFYGLSRRPC